jgi:3-oxoacyl-[acyl-carrier-protein] synthase II
VTNNTICQGDVSSLLAIIESAAIIQRGHADVMISGGSSSRLSVTPMLYRGIQRLSQRTDQPHCACRPFDATRDGTVNGEGAAVFVLESESHARQRGAHIRARVRGWGLGFKSRNEGKPALVDAVQQSLQNSLSHAVLEPAAVGHVNAHAAGLVRDDAEEARAIHRVLGDVPVTAPKSFFGSIGSGGGAVELVASILALEKGHVPVTLNYNEPDPDCPVDVVHGQPRQVRHGTAVVLNQAPTGQAAALVLEAGDPHSE